jgi:hypothetical protein
LFISLSAGRGAVNTASSVEAQEFDGMLRMWHCHELKMVKQLWTEFNHVKAFVKDACAPSMTIVFTQMDGHLVGFLVLAIRYGWFQTLALVRRFT